MCKCVFRVKYTLRIILRQIILIKRNARSHEKLIVLRRYLNLALIAPLFLNYFLSSYFLIARIFLFFYDQER